MPRQFYSPVPASSCSGFWYSVFALLFLSQDKAMMPSPSTFSHLLPNSRSFVTFGISNEPHNAESLVRYRLYSNEFDTCGLVKCMHFRMVEKWSPPEEMTAIINASAQVFNNHNCNVHNNNYIRGLMCEDWLFTSKQRSSQVFLLVKVQSYCSIDWRNPKNSYYFYAGMWLTCFLSPLWHLHNRHLSADQFAS